MPKYLALFYFPVIPPEAESGGYQRLEKLSRTKPLSEGTKRNSSLEPLTGEGRELQESGLWTHSSRDSLTYLACELLTFSTQISLLVKFV